MSIETKTELVNGRLPFACSADEVRAILAGGDVEIKRVIEWPVTGEGFFQCSREHFEWCIGLNGFQSPANEIMARLGFGSPHERVRLAVLEPWQLCNWDWDFGEARFRYEADGEEQAFGLPEDSADKWSDWMADEMKRLAVLPGVYLVDYDDNRLDKRPEDAGEQDFFRFDECSLPWRPAAEMPAWASRLGAVVKSRRVELIDGTWHAVATVAGECRKCEGYGVRVFPGTHSYITCPGCNGSRFIAAPQPETLRNDLNAKSACGSTGHTAQNDAPREG